MTVENSEMPLLAKFQQRGHERLGVQCDIIYRTWSASPFVPHHGWTCHSQWDLTDLGTVTSVQWLWLPHWLILGFIVLLSTTFLSWKEKQSVTWELPVRIQPLQVLLSVRRTVDGSFPSLPRAEKVDRTPVWNQILPNGELLAYIHSFIHLPHLLRMRTTCQACSPGLGMQTLDPGRFPDAILETESPRFLTLEVYNTITRL